MTNRFAEAMAGRTTQDLEAVLSAPADDWELEAIEAAREELAKRGSAIRRDDPEPQPRPLRVEEEGGWIRWAFLVAGIAFSLAVPFNLLTADFANAAGGVVLGAAGIGGFLAMHRARMARAAFLRWLAESSVSVQRGTAVWEGMPIRPTTTVRTFEVAVSLLVLSSKFSSRFIVEGDPAVGRIKLRSTAVTLLLGWWGLPFGPVFTLGALYRNLHGGRSATVASVLAGMGSPSRDRTTA